MSEALAQIIAGRKTFFITPDTALLPESYLEEYLESGFEAYFVENDKACPLERKIDILLSVFKDSILFFDIDAQIGINWPVYLNHLQKKYEQSILIGVLYARRQSTEECRLLEKYYLFDVGIKCGCVALDYQKKNNYSLIKRILYANQAMGRRKTVRALCPASCTFQFEKNGLHYSGIIKDVSLSHFSCIFEEQSGQIEVNERIDSILFNLKGLHFTGSAVLCMHRPSEERDMYIFMFVTNNDSGLDAFTKQLLLPKIYEIMSGNCRGILDQLFYHGTSKAIPPASPADKKTTPAQDSEKTAKN